MQRTRLVALAFAAAFVTSLACDSKPEAAPAKAEPAKTGPEPATTEPATTEPAKPETAPRLAPAAANTAGPAFFAVDKVGVVKLDDDGFSVVAGSPNTLQKDMQVGPDGALYMLGFEDIYRLEGAGMVSIARGGFDVLGASPDHLAVAPGGDLWVTTFKGVARWDGKAWTTEDKAKIGAGDDLLEAV
ncbi:MAG TPA: hypothetical protein VGB85_02360, partial [Nannocystis sp.]